MEKMAASADEQKIFSEDKKRINFALLETTGIILLLVMFVVILVALTIATLSVAAINYFGPTKLIAFGFDLSVAVDWLAANGLTVFLLTIAAYFYVWLLWREIKKEAAERRLAN